MSRLRLHAHVGEPSGDPQTRKCPLLPLDSAFYSGEEPRQAPGVPLPSEVLGDGPLEAGQEDMGCDRTVG